MLRLVPRSYVASYIWCYSKDIQHTCNSAVGRARF